MYSKHFGLSEKPFSMIPDADSIYFSPNHKAAFATLEFGLLEQVGVTVITGDVGAGKTTLLRHLLQRVDYNDITVGLISTTHRSFGNLLQWIISALDIDIGSDTAAVDGANQLKAIQSCVI
jgi:general secretion pathway protein A